MTALALVLALAVCQSDEDLLKAIPELESLQKPADEAELCQAAAEALPRVAGQMGLPAPAHLVTRVVGRDETRRKMLEVLRRQYPGDRLSRLGSALRLVHLVGPDEDLEKIAVDLYSKGAGGFYDPHDGVLYLLADQPSYAQQMVVPHELAHAVQDKKLGLDRLIAERADSEDAQMAFSAAIEGNAQAVGASAVLGGQDEGGAFAGLMGEMSAASAHELSAAGGAPRWLELQMRFPYAAGALLVKALATAEDPSGTRILSRLPLSTAQVIDPELYRKNEKPLKGKIGLVSLIPDSAPVYETVLGRANIDLLGEMNGAAASLGEGWRGDRLEAVKVAGRTCGAWAVTFATPEQAARFAKAYASILSATADEHRWRTTNPDGTVSGVARKKSSVAVLEHVPPGAAAAVETAALHSLQ